MLQTMRAIVLTAFATAMHQSATTHLTRSKQLSHSTTWPLTSPSSHHCRMGSIMSSWSLTFACALSGSVCCTQRPPSPCSTP
ncbi:hypothetical protein BC828DRAFT_388838 [Blastocladiella britannica]|nr:hypothetical protein BC828DRAFT_388838 [Blastocladiella britannica]